MPNPLSQYGVSDRDFAAAVATAVGEAGDQGTVGMAAVVDVLNNRTQIDDFSSRYGTSIADQAMARNGKEFNAWKTTDPVYGTTKRVYEAVLSGDDSNLSAAEKRQMAAAVEAAVGVLGNGPMLGITEGADSYQNSAVTDKWGTSGPQYAMGRLNGKFDIGDHTFTGHRAFGFTPDGFDLDAAKAANERNSAWFNAPGQYDPLSSVTPKPNGTYDAERAAGMSFTPGLPAPMPGVQPMDPGFRFSSMPFGIGAPEAPAPARSYDPLSSVRAPQAPAPAPGWGSIAGGAIAAPRAPVRDYGPDWSTPGPGIPETSTPDYTTGSAGTFAKTPPSTMSVPAPKTTVADPPAPAFGFGVNAPMTFSSMRPKLSAVTSAVAAADEQAAAEMDRETARAKALGALPQEATMAAAPGVKPPVKAPPPARIVKPKIAPVPIAPPPAPRESRAAKEPPSWNDPGATLRDQFGKPSDFMGTGVGASDFAKGVAAVAAINGDDKAKAYAGQLTSERPGISGVAFDALSNEYAKATGQAQTPTLYDRLASSTLGQAFGMNADIPAFNGYGASNSPKSQQGMFVQGANNQPTWANYSADQQRALQNSSGLWGSIQNAFGFGAGQNNGWGAPGSMGYGPGTSGLW